MNPAVVRYAGTAPGADTNLYPLFDSTEAFPGKRYPQNAGYKRFYITITHSSDGSFVISKSNDRGATWHAVATVAVTFASGVAATLDRLIEDFDDFKVEWSNTSGAAQDPWEVNMAFSDERGSAT